MIPVDVNRSSWFYPLGNTTACSLTQDLPAEGPAAILSLGCGDIRHPLFTSHLEPERKINITCVDYDAALIARNVLMLSLILEGKDDWEMYYHTKISSSSLEVIRAQAEKLCDLTQWDGKIQFLDQGTLEKVKAIWKCYGSGSDLQTALLVRRKMVGEDVYIYSGARSAEPCPYDALQDLPGLHNKFWKHGTVDGTIAECLNPLFFSSSIMHYGTDPLTGFHLALGYAPIKDGAQGPVAAAKAEFACWAQTFRRSLTTIKYCCSDALSFCRSLQGCQEYRNSHTMDLLVLEKQTFDVIDTSNLADHLGAINVMIASSPLLNPNGLLRMEVLLVKDQPAKILDELLNGDLLTISSLLGLILLEHATNASASSTIDMSLLIMAVSSMESSRQGKKQMLLKFSWRAVPAMICDANELASVLHSVYGSMFESENMSKRMDGLMAKIQLKDLESFPRFHRGSFAHLLRAVQGSSTDWTITISRLLELIESDQEIMLTGQYIQELYLWLHLLDLFTTDAIMYPLSVKPLFSNMHNFWPSLPGFVWITVKVPRPSLQQVASLNDGLSSIPVHGIVESAVKRFQNFFASLQIVFGEIQTIGLGENLSIQLVEDADSRRSNSPAFVSFRVPSWILMVEGDKTVVGLGVQSTMYTTLHLVSKLGLELNIYLTSLGNTSNVFVTKDPPNTSNKGPVAIQKYRTYNSNATKGVLVNNKLQSMITRLKIVSPDEQTALLAGSEVTYRQITPWDFELSFAKFKHQLKLSAPASSTRCKLRIARKSAYLELVTSPLSAEERCAVSPFPVLLTTTGVRLINIPRVTLDALPTLDVRGRINWLNTHVSLSFSISERKIRETSTTKTLNPRVDFKDSLFSQYMLSSGLQGNSGCVEAIGFVNEASQGIAVVVFVHKLRLDLSNRTVLLDVAILPILKVQVDKIGHALGRLTGHLGYVETNDAELKIWKQVLPAFIERCRTWSHADTCEYQKAGRVPLSYEPNEQFLCTCGNGRFPKDYLKNAPGWPELASYCVRAAISPCFAVPYVDELVSEARHGVLGNVCWHCMKKEPHTGLKDCGRCRKAKYCSPECQKKDWPKHKSSCKKQ